MGEHVILQPMLAHHLLAAHLADVQRALEMRHLRMDLQRVQVGKALATILAGVAESRLLVHRLDMLTQCAAAAQDLAAVRTGVGAQRRVVRALVAAQRLPILKGLATDGARRAFTRVSCTNLMWRLSAWALDNTASGQREQGNRRPLWTVSVWLTSSVFDL